MKKYIVIIILLLMMGCSSMEPVFIKTVNIGNDEKGIFEYTISAGKDPFYESNIYIHFDLEE